MEKIEMDVYKSLEMIFKIIRPVKIAEYADTSYSILLRKTKKTPLRGKPMVFTEENVEKLNEVFERIGNEIGNIQISYLRQPTEDDANDTKTQMLQIKEYFQPSYIYGKLGKTAVWFAVRMKPYDRTIKNYYFSEDDVLKINLAIREASNLLLSIRNMISSPNS